MKYIIELKDEPKKGIFSDDGNYYQCKQIPYWSISESMINKLTPYTEPDRKAIGDEVWELADYMCRMGVRERDVCFGFQLTTEVTANLSYNEAKSKFEAWLKQEDEIHVGDEVEYGFIRGIAFIVDEVLVEGFYINDKENVGEHFWWNKKDCKKTGRHFDEVAELLEKMREDT